LENKGESPWLLSNLPPLLIKFRSSERSFVFIRRWEGDRLRVLRRRQEVEWRNEEKVRKMINGGVEGQATEFSPEPEFGSLYITWGMGMMMMILLSHKNNRGSTMKAVAGAVVAVGHFPPNDFLLSIYLKANGRSRNGQKKFLISFHLLSASASAAGWRLWLLMPLLTQSLHYSFSE